jgi:hypothetical protein
LQKIPRICTIRNPLNRILYPPLGHT